MFLLPAKLHLKSSGSTQAFDAIKILADRIEATKPANGTMQKVYIEAGEFFGTEGEDKKAYDACAL